MAIGTAGYVVENITFAAAAYKLGSIIMYNIKPPAAASAAGLGKDESLLFMMQVATCSKGGALNTVVGVDLAALAWRGRPLSRPESGA